jgi:hypothetical protein
VGVGDRECPQFVEENADIYLAELKRKERRPKGDRREKEEEISINMMVQG